MPPERDIRGADLDAATGLHDAHLTGAHLRLPGHGDAGPTLEIFSYDELEAHPGDRVDRPGWGHVAFQVPDVPAAVEAVLAAGGGRIGDVITIADRRRPPRHLGLHDGSRGQHRRAAGLVGGDRPDGPTRRRLRIPADLDRLAEVRALVREVATSCGAPAVCIDDLVQAVDEAVTNVILHGYRGAPGWLDVSRRARR